MISSSLLSVQSQKPAPPNVGDLPLRRNHAGKWISALGWLLIAGALISLLISFSDWQNFAILTIAGVVFIPLGLLLVTNGRILSKLVNIEKNTRMAAEVNPAREAPNHPRS